MLGCPLYATFFLVAPAPEVARVSLPLRIERAKATAIRAIDAKRAEYMPVTNVPASDCVSLLTPRKIRLYRD